MAVPRPRLPASSLVHYGVIGDLHTAALVSKEGGVDWLCLPRLDSPSVFAALLDDERGGRLRIAPRGEYASSQSYLPDTNILRTEFATPSGRGVLTTFMPVESIDGEEYAEQEVHALFEVTEGTLEIDAEFSPRFNYALALTKVERRPHGVLARGGGHSLAFASDLDFGLDEDSGVAAWTGRAGDRIRFVLRYDTEGKLESTAAFWRAWTDRCSYRGRWRDAVVRSALALKLLTYAPTGALAAAATTSLPEAPGGERNWDYRYSWVRDSAFAMQVFHALGYTREARRYLRWLRRLLRNHTSHVGALQVCYGLEGETEAPETELGHLRGYLDSRPVRVGNAAIDQFQLDTFGALASAVYEAYGRPEGYPDEAWRTVRALADYVAEHWRDPDHGIWEIRGPKRPYTHSALTCWVALDRAIRIAHARGHPEYEQRWGVERDAIRDAIHTRGWSDRAGAFTQAFDGDALDASLLLMPLVGFIDPRDPRWLSTLDAIDRDLGQGPFVYRYRAPDNLSGQEGTFLLCAFWMVQALAKAGRVEEARRRFDALSRLAGPVGLFSEEVEPASGLSLGNFPQALTHLSHIAAALALEDAEAHAERVRTAQPA
jgi:GH15 family glucan-1,4-alpha-glucosidase